MDGSDRSLDRPRQALLRRRLLNKGRRVKRPWWYLEKKEEQWQRSRERNELVYWRNRQEATGAAETNPKGFMFHQEAFGFQATWGWETLESSEHGQHDLMHFQQILGLWKGNLLCLETADLVRGSGRLTPHQHSEDPQLVVKFLIYFEGRTNRISWRIWCMFWKEERSQGQLQGFWIKASGRKRLPTCEIRKLNVNLDFRFLSKECKILSTT